MADPVADPAALPIVPCPDCGRNVVTYVARRRQNAGQRFYKCRNHNVSQVSWIGYGCFLRCLAW
uniref:Zinc finger GRF-type domain-containing protein n=1 Tax=Aegilops tauschii subsp. strangulata TaxID=200361 RepID=A0A453BTM0_AEGTS